MNQPELIASEAVVLQVIASEWVTVQEVPFVSDLIMLAKRLPPVKHAEIWGLAAAYARSVSLDEWPLMSQGDISSRAEGLALALTDAVTDFEPMTEGQKAIYPAAIEAASDLSKFRRLRTNTATRGIPTLEWFVLILGGTITIAFTYFCVLDRLRVQVVMTALVALIISLNIYLVSMFGYPYSGDLKITPSGFDLGGQMADDGMASTR